MDCLRRGAIGSALAVLGVGLVAPGVASAQPASTSGTSESVPISFQVNNVNRSKIACASDGKTYTVRGHLVRPSTAVVGRGMTGPVTLYLHGLGLGEVFWDFQGVPGYDYAAAEAAAGQTSVVIDRLGYGASDKPAGPGICIGSQADIAHQMVVALREGRYQLGSGASPDMFPQVILAGHSLGAAIAQAEAYSFGDIDGLILMSYTDQGISTLTKVDVESWTAACASGGMHVTDSTGPTGYAPFAPSTLAAQTFFLNPDLAVQNAILGKGVRDPCGDQTSFMTSVSADMAHLGEIKVPILFVVGAKDALFPPPANNAQILRYSGSPSVTSVTIPGASHALTLVPSRRILQTTVLRWLNSHAPTMPTGAPATGGGSTAGTEQTSLFTAGSTAIIAGLTLALISTRRRRHLG